MKRSIAIIGGGISGLAAACRLTAGGPDLDLVLFERDARLGGKILTERSDQYVIEGGPDSFLSAKPRGIELSLELGLGDRLIEPDQRHRGAFVLRDNGLIRIPEGLTGLVPSRLKPMFSTPLLSPLGKVRLACDLAIRPRQTLEDESLASFVERRLGREMYDRLIEPLMSGIYAGDGRQLSLAATFPGLRAAERTHGGMIRGAMAVRKAAAFRRDPHGARASFVSFQAGMAELVDAIVRRIEDGGVCIRTETPVLAINRRADGGRGFDIETTGPGDAQRQSFDAVIVAVPAWAAAPLVDPWSPDASDAIAGIPHVSNAIVTMAFTASQCPHDLNGSGYIVPRSEHRPVMAVTWVSSKWRQRTPENHILVRAFIGRAGQQEYLTGDDASLQRIARSEFQDVLGITGAPVLSRVFRWDRGMPQYNLGHLDRVDRIQLGIGRVPGLEIAGNMLRGVGIPDCIASGEAAADHTLSYLRESWAVPMEVVAWNQRAARRAAAIAHSSIGRQIAESSVQGA